MKYQSGNALFLILIAVALFAALSYAITSSGRGGGNIDREQAEIYVSEISNYAALVENAVSKMKLLNGCSDTQISFDSDEWPLGTERTAYDDSNRSGFLDTPPTDQSCNLFNTAGGGIDLRFNENWSDTSASSIGYYRTLPYFTGHPFIRGAGITGAPAIDHTDLVVVFPFVKKEICDALNDKIGIDTPPIVPGIALNARLGSNPYSANTQHWIDSGNVLEGKFMACFEGKDHVGGQTDLLVGRYFIYQVLIAR